MTGRPTTEDFITSLAGRPPPPRHDGGRTAGAMAAAGLAGLCLFWLAFGVRADLAAMLAAPVTLAKIALPLAVAVLGLWLALRSARPEARLRLSLMLLPAGAAVALFLARLAVVAPDAVIPELMGQTARACLVSITGLALAPIAAGLILLRRGATTRPGRSGALIGLTAAAGVAAGYALHCTEDSPLFYTLWYGLAILLGGAIGGLAGRWLLRW